MVTRMIKRMIKRTIKRMIQRMIKVYVVERGWWEEWQARDGIAGVTGPETMDGCK